MTYDIFSITKVISLAGDDDAEEKVGQIKNPTIHVDSIRSPYIGTSIKRYPLTVNQVPWEVSTVLSLV